MIELNETEEVFRQLSASALLHLMMQVEQKLAELDEKLARLQPWLDFMDHQQSGISGGFHPTSPGGTTYNGYFDAFPGTSGIPEWGTWTVQSSSTVDPTGDLIDVQEFLRRVRGLT